jgi:integral membrane sensor domain MASE1
MTLLIVIEMMWTVFPTQAISSLILQFCHFFILFALLVIPKTNYNEKHPSLWKLLFYLGIVTVVMAWTFGPKFLKTTQKFIVMSTKDEL